ncbi:MAG: deoxynucleotide monophosphate kinase [Gammaproteobacteria bacterium]|nr:deoxynucleotide monophosphate kinase [Gammaproteobacteria bacterium]
MRKIIGLAAKARSGKDTVASMLMKQESVSAYALADPLKIACQALFGLTDKETWDDEIKERKIPLWGRSPREFFQLVGTDWLRNLNPEHWLLRADQVLNHGAEGSDLASDADLADSSAHFYLAAQAVFGLSHPEAWDLRNQDLPIGFWEMTPNEMTSFLKKKARSSFKDYDELRSQRPVNNPTRTLPRCNSDVVIIKDIRFENEAAFLRERKGVIWHIVRDKKNEVNSHSSEAGIQVQPSDVTIDNNGTLQDLQAVVDFNWRSFSDLRYF